MKHFAAFAAKYEAVLRAMKRTFGTLSESLDRLHSTKNKSRPFGGLNFWWSWRHLNITSHEVMSNGGDWWR